MSGERIDRLWGCGDIDMLFPGGAEVTTTPWPRGNKVKHGVAYNRESLRLLLESAVELVDIDPRHVRCSQPALLRTHVAHYLTGRWERFGRTSADEHAEHNQFPLIVSNHRGHDLVVSGHHRTAAALIEGRPVRARIAAGSNAFCVTPLLRVTADAPPVDIDTVADRLRDGRPVAVGCLHAAGKVLALAGATPEEAGRAIGLASRRAGPGRAHDRPGCGGGCDV